jgi:uncharacterized protein
MLNQIGLTVLSGLLIAIGVIGAIVPMIPGPPFAYLGLLLHGFVIGFDNLSLVILIILGVLTLLTLIVDFFAPMLGGAGYKSSPSGTRGALIGALLGFMFFGPLGVILGPFVGAFVGEFISVPDTKRALKTLHGVFMGLILGAAFKFVVSIAIGAYFIVTLF